VPEGNEIHRYGSRHAELFAGRSVRVESPNGRFEDGAARLHGRKLRAVEAYGKHLFYDFGRNRKLHVHLGLYGKFRDGEMPAPEPRGALRLRISTAQHWLELRGPTDCSVFDDEQQETLLARIGPDPLRDDADPAVVIKKITRSRAPIGALLMDQSVISGLGNIFRAELLYRAKLNPFLAGQTVNSRQLRAIWRDARELMQAATVDRRIVTTRPKDRPHPTGKARRYETHYVYRRKGAPCFVCGTTVAMQMFVGRKLFWCPGCQPGPSGSGENSGLLS
jgi:endonuclease VIII